MESTFKFVFVMLTLIGMPMTIMYVLAPLARAIGHRLEGAHAADRGELDALRAEVEMLRDLPSRVADLEDRVDFAERTLQRQRDEAMPVLRGGTDAAR